MKQYPDTPIPEALPFRTPAAEDFRVMESFFSLRPNRTCESGVLDTFIWISYYNTKFCICDGKALLFLMENETETFSALPLCAEEDLPYYFKYLELYFNQILHKPLKIYLADEEGVEALGLKDNPDYYTAEQDDLKDYLYNAEELRTLPGKRFHKKKNLISKFLRDYEGRWTYRTLGGDDSEIILDFLNRWFASRKEAVDEKGLSAEHEGIAMILQNYALLSYRVGGIFIDGVLEAFSIGTLNPRENMAVVSIEKANVSFTGLYQLINREFLLHEFPGASLVNREDDVGVPGLRQAKMSYNPIGYEKKYMVVQRSFPGSPERYIDYYEEEIRREQ